MVALAALLVWLSRSGRGMHAGRFCRLALSLLRQHHMSEIDELPLPVWPSTTFQAWAEAIYNYARQRFLADGYHAPLCILIDGGDHYHLLDLSHIFDSQEGRVAAALAARGLIHNLDAQAIAFISEIWTKRTQDGPRLGEQLMVNVESRDGEKVCYFGDIAKTATQHVVVDRAPLVNLRGEGLFTNFFEDLE